jgi:hypothetical protein
MTKESKIFLLKELGFSSDGTYVLDEKGEKVLDRYTDEPVRLDIASIVNMLKYVHSLREIRGMPLRTGKWKINANGSEGELYIKAIDTEGNLSGTVFGNDQILGFWDDFSQRITFMRIVPPLNLLTIQIFTGYLFQNPIAPTAGQNVKLTLTGFFDAFKGTGRKAQRVLCGWFAQTEIIS